jgi:hypothetical protein
VGIVVMVAVLAAIASAVAETRRSCTSALFDDLLHDDRNGRIVRATDHARKMS